MTAITTPGIERMDYSEIKKRLAEQFPLGPASPHGPQHWRRVERYALHLANHNGGNPVVAELFAWFHDSRRVTEDRDPEHGLRGAELARQMKMQLQLDEEAFETLFQACAGHTDLTFSHDPTIAACWDADRLDLDRVGIDPDPSYFSTAEGKRLALLPTITRRMETGIPLEPPRA